MNVFGETSERLTPWYSPINITQEQENKFNDELHRLEINIGTVDNVINKIKLNNEEYREYQELAGQLAKQNILKIINSSGYHGMNADNQAKAIQNAANDGKEQARIQLNKQYGNKFKLGSTSTTTTPSLLQRPTGKIKGKGKIIR